MNNLTYSHSFQKIENYFKSHLRYPFTNFKTNDTDRGLLTLFIKYLTHFYINNQDLIKWNATNPYLTSEKTNVLLDIYNLHDNKMFYIFIEDASDPQLYESNLYIKAFRDDRFFWDKPLEFHTYTLGIEINLRHPLALDKAREFMHAFFIDKLPLEKMQQKIDDFEQFEAHLFKRKQ